MPLTVKSRLRASFRKYILGELCQLGSMSSSSESSSSSLPPPPSVSASSSLFSSPSVQLDTSTYGLPCVGLKVLTCATLNRRPTTLTRFHPNTCCMSAYFASVITSKSLGFAPCNKSLTAPPTMYALNPRPDNRSQISHTSRGITFFDPGGSAA